MTKTINVWVRYRDGRPDEHEVDGTHPLWIFRDAEDGKVYLSDEMRPARLVIGDQMDDEIVETEIRVPHDVVMVRRDHHILTYLRAVSKLTGGSVGFPVADIDNLWQSAYELGIECGAAIAHAANQKPKRKGK